MKLTLLAVVANAAIVLSATVAPTEHPTEHPTVIPTVEPSVKPTAAPSIAPTLLPTVEPSVKPTAAPSIAPTLLPTVEPSVKPTAAPSIAPTLLPTVEPSVKPTVLPTVEPSVKPTVQPTIAPTLLPTVEPSVKPTVLPTMAPTVMPTVLPTVMPTVVPTVMPTVTPTVMPTVAPSLMPTVMPTVMPTIAPSLMPTIHPTVQPSETPTQPPSHHPTISGPGWLIQSYYTNDSSTDPVVVYGTRTQECLAANQNLLPDTYYKYSCGDGYIQFQIYNDSSCTHQDHQSEISLDFEWNLEGIAFNQHYGPEYIRYWYLDLQTIRFQCVDDANLYSFAADQKYAVTEFYPTDGTENDESEQCDTDYTQFAAYQKGYCFGIYKYQDEDYHYYNFYDNDYERFAYYKFSASDDTFISLTSFSSDDCSYESDEYFIHNIFPVDECEANFYDGYFDAAHKKAEKRVIKNHAANPLRFDSSTPTAMQMVMSESLAKAQNKPYVSLEQRAKNHNDQVRAHLEQKHPEKLKAMRKAAETRKAAAETRKAAAETRKAAPAPAVATTAAAGSKKTKDIPAWDYPWTDDYYVPKAESGNAYFTDDHYGNDYASAYYYMDDDFFIPGASKDQYLSEYYVWKNVPALTTAPAPQQWFTEVVYAWDEEEDDDKVALVSTRQTQQCMAFMEDGYVEFNYKIFCQGEYVIVMYYEWDDVTCAGDYYTQTKYYEYLTDNYGDDFGKREYDMDDYMYECSNVMFSSEWANATADNTYATEFFYPLAGYNETNDDYTAVECPIASEETESVTMAVAILQDWCFTIYSNWDNNYFSAKYWVDQEDNNQNIQFTVWEAPDCNNKFVTQTKEVEINHCYDEQPNSVYQYYYYWWDAKSKDSLAKETKQDVTFANKALMQFTKHDTMKTRFNQLLVKGMPKKMKARRQAAIQKIKNAVQTKQADKKTESAYDDYYYYYDQGNAFFNNRQSHSKNQWFSIPTSATIPPSETPSLAPSEMPSIAPTMAPVPPTLRPTPSAGSPTASPTHQVTYTFEAEQILEGITAEEFNSNENNTIVFQEAVAMAIPPLTADNIEVSSVIDTVAARRLRGLTSNSVNITYWVTYRVAETGYNDAETAYDALVNGLTTAIEETDLFDGYITVLVEKYVSDMEGTTSNSVWESEATQIGTDDDSKPNTRNHHKVLVGVLVGLGGGLLLIALIAYCIFGRGEQAQAQSYSNPQSVEMTGVDPTTHKSAI